MKTLGKIPDDQIKKVISEAYMNIYVDENKLFNPLMNIPEHMQEHPDGYIAWLLMQPEYFHFICREIMNVNILPIQGVVLKELWRRKFPMLVASRGFGKSYLLALYSMIRILLLANRKIVVCGAAFRQSKIIFEYMETIWNNAPILRDIVGVTNNGPKREADMFRFFIGESRVSALPIGTGDKIRGQRANDIISDEFACLTSDTLVQTDIGLIRIKDYLDGDAIDLLNRDKQFETPTHIFKTPKTDVYQITTDNGYSFKCSAIHQVLTQDGWKLARELNSKDNLELDNNDYFPTKNIVRNDIELNEKMAWLLGILVSEGTVTNRNYIIITNGDKRLIDYVKTEYCEYDWKEQYTKPYIDPRGWDCKECWNIQYNNTEFRDVLHKMGVEYVTSHNKMIPRDILLSPKSVILSYLSGYFEGDGTGFNYMDKGKKRVGIACYSASKSMLDTLQILLLKFNIICSVTKKTSNISEHDNWMLSLRGPNAKKIYDLLHLIKWENQFDEADFFIRKPQIKKNGNSFVLSTTRGNKNKYIGSYKSEEECNIAFKDFWSKTREVMRVRSVVVLPEQENLYDFHLPQTNSFIGNGFVQHNSIPREIFETVIGGFAAVNANPITNVIERASNKFSNTLNIEHIDANKTDVDNQTIISGTADYDFNHFYDYWCNWKDIITTKGDRKKIAAYLNKKNPENFIDEHSIPSAFNWQDYSIIRIPYELIPEGFMDAATVSRAKASVHYGTFLCEYGACFSKDSNGFYKRTLVENCTCNESNPIYHPSGPVFFKSSIIGNPTKKYVYGIDPAAEVDNFAIVVLELHADHRRIVYGWTTNKKNQKELLADGTITERDYYSFCARKIRDLMKKFPCAGIAIDSQGGGLPVMERLNDTDKIRPGEQFIWPLINPEKPSQTDGETGMHIMNIVNFSSADWTTNANHNLKSDMETKSLIFPFFDAIELATVENADGKSSNTDSLESCMLEIEELKSELSTIVISKTPTGRYKWDTPELKLPGNKKGRLRKDRYSALLMANDLARSIEIFNPKPIESSYEGGFAHTFLREDTNGPSYKGPSAIADKLNALYS